jgi:hypothetical protein
MLDIAGRCKIVLRQKDYAAYTAPESEDYAFVFSAESAESRKMHCHVFGAVRRSRRSGFFDPGRQKWPPPATYGSLQKTI